ncbi:hypothetical protein L5515_019470 [Caenorhabditis briggsae]|uniref:Uncharacterized protein n=1 Tax=Caenorhabditis briggsae TaxID=6238 RepID=A0AAE9FEB7_CAEBR|nr:hypothetical protein L5515_019470 [Caenorhabditis briggsae]
MFNKSVVLTCSRTDHTANIVGEYRFLASFRLVFWCIYKLRLHSKKGNTWLSLDENNAFRCYSVDIGTFVGRVCCGQLLKIILKLSLHLKRHQLQILWWNH